jgi:hypothetical protein
VNCIVVSGESGYPQSALDYGSTTASTTGTQVNTSGSNNTKGAWTQITAATTRSHFWGLICVRAVSGTQFLLDVGIGGAGSEQVIVPNLNIRDSSNGDPAMWSVPLRIPSGTRVAMRAAAATGSSNVSANLVLL